MFLPQAFIFSAHCAYTAPCTVSVNSAEHMEKNSRPEIICRRLVRNIFRPVRACAKRSAGKMSRPEKNYHDTGLPYNTAELQTHRPTFRFAP